MPNSLMSIHDRAFEGLMNVSVLSIRNCNLFLPPALHLISRTLKSVQMASNHIEEIPDDYFRGCKHLETIGISNSKLQQVPNLNDTHGTLKYLYLFNNNITYIRQLYGVSFPGLNVLDLARNKIMSVEVHSMILPVIWYVSFDGNRLAALPDLTQSGWGKDLSETKNLSISIGTGNPWHCSAEMLWVVDMTCKATNISNQLHCIIIENLDIMICSTPTNLAGKPITEVGKLNNMFPWCMRCSCRFEFVISMRICWVMY